MRCIVNTKNVAKSLHAHYLDMVVDNIKYRDLLWVFSLQPVLCDSVMCDNIWLFVLFTHIFECCRCGFFGQTVRHGLSVSFCVTLGPTFFYMSSRRSGTYAGPPGLGIRSMDCWVINRSCPKTSWLSHCVLPILAGSLWTTGSPRISPSTTSTWHGQEHQLSFPLRNILRMSDYRMSYELSSCFQSWTFCCKTRIRIYTCLTQQLLVVLVWKRVVWTPFPWTRACLHSRLCRLSVLSPSWNSRPRPSFDPPARHHSPL